MILKILALFAVLTLIGWYLIWLVCEIADEWEVK
jgi:hypothetical protein